MKDNLLLPPHWIHWYISPLDECSCAQIGALRMSAQWMQNGRVGWAIWENNDGNLAEGDAPNMEIARAEIGKKISATPDLLLRAGQSQRPVLSLHRTPRSILESACASG